MLAQQVVVANSVCLCVCLFGCFQILRLSSRSLKACVVVKLLDQSHEAKQPTNNQQHGRTNKRTSKQADNYRNPKPLATRLESKETNKQASKQVNKQTNKRKQTKPTTGVRDKKQIRSQ